MRWKVVSLAVLLIFGLSVVARGQTGDLTEAHLLEAQFLKLQEQGKYVEAARLGEQVLNIREKVFGPEHPDTAASLNGLAVMYGEMGDYKQAVTFHQRALDIREKVFGPEHPDIAASLNNLALVYYQMGNYGMARSLYLQALAIW